MYQGIEPIFRILSVKLENIFSLNVKSLIVSRENLQYNKIEESIERRATK